MDYLPGWVSNALRNCKQQGLRKEAMILEARISQLESIRYACDAAVNTQIGIVEPMNDDEWPGYNYRCALCGHPRRRLNNDMHEDHCLIHMLQDADHNSLGVDAMRMPFWICGRTC